MKIEFFEECIPPKTTKQQQGYRRYAPDKVTYAKAFLTAVMEKHRPSKPLTGAIKALLVFTYPHTKESKKLGKPVVEKTTRPDVDNLSKLPWDIMQKAGFYTDDARIYSATIEKYHGDIPGITVKLEENDEYSKTKGMKQ